MLVSYHVCAEYRKPATTTKPIVTAPPAFTLDDIHHIEDAHIVHLARQVEVSMQLFPHENMSLRTLVNGGMAALTTPFLGQQVNRTLGLGMKGPVTLYDIQHLEDLHLQSNLSPSILLCPYADPSALQALAVRGYGVDSFLNIYARNLHDIPIAFDPSITPTDNAEYTFAPDSQVLRAPATDTGMAAFIHSSVSGFKDSGKQTSVLQSLAEMAAFRPDTILYLAKINGQIAGCGALALIETEHGRVAHLYIDSTMPWFRGRGIQRTLIRARMMDAKRLGYNFVTIHANPGVGTGRNAEKEGFRLAFTKPIFTKRS